MGMLITFITPSFLSFNRREILKQGATQLLNGIEQTQSLALAGVQTGNAFVTRYRFKLVTRGSYYGGYQIQRLNEAGNVIEEPVDEQTISCNVCISSPVSQIDYTVPSGRVVGLSGSSTTLSVCYQGVGQHTVTVDVSGRITGSNFQTSSCSCPSSCP